MDNQKNNFSGNDSDLDLLFKTALQNHAVPTEDHVWRRIQHGLADKSTVIPIAKRSYLPIWSALSGVAASLLIWAIFFTSSSQEHTNTNTIAKSDKIETKTPLDFNFKKNQKNKNIEATSSNIIASKKQQIPPTITIKNIAHKNQNVKSINTQKQIERAVASLEKDQTKIKNQKSEDKINEKTFTNPSTHIAQNVWASDFVVQNSNTSTSLKKEATNTDTHQLNIDNQTVAITIKVGKNDNSSNNASQATGFDTNPSQLDKAKSVLKEVWNLKTGKKVNLQKILPNNENEKATQKTTTNQSNQDNEIQAD